MAQTSLLPPMKQQFFDANGDPLNGGKLYFYEPGTSTLKDIYSDSGGETTLSNPVILDSAGRAAVWLNGYYKVIVNDSDDATIYTVDNVSSQYAESNTNFQFINQSDTPTYIGTTQFSVLTDLTATYEAGRRIKAAVTAGTIYGTITASSAGGSPVITTVTCLWDSGELDSGLSAVALGVITIANTARPLFPVIEKTAGYSMDIADINRFIQANSANALDITLLGANEVPSGAWNWYKNNNSGAATIVGTINGTANHTLYNKDALFVYSDGNAWNAPGSMLNIPPIGAIIAWHKSLTGVPQTLPYGWVECNGQTLSDADSPINGEVIPDMNGDARFIRGSNVSGTTQTSQVLTHGHSANASANGVEVDVVQKTASITGVYFQDAGSGFRTLESPAGTDYNRLVVAANANEATPYAVKAAEMASNIDITVDDNGSNESRPVNISMVWIMRVK